MSVRRVTVGVAVLIAAALLYYSLRGVDWRDAGRTIAGANVPLLVVAAGIASATLFLRGLRWRVLLTAAGPVGLGHAFWATSAGQFGNNFLPARAGELVRTYMISSQTGLPNSYVFATALAERVVDAIFLVFVSAVVLLTIPSPPGWLAHAARPFGLIGLAGAIAIAVLPFTGSIARTLIGRLPVPHALQAKLAGAVEQAFLGLRTFHDPSRLAGFIALAVVIWLLDTIGTIVVARALGISLPLRVAFLLITGLSMGSALPSTPGYVGIYQFVAVTVLSPFGVSRTDAIAFILVSQALMYIVIGVWGAIGLHQWRSAKRAL
jgi:uncharacterized protein (TIRG00374 family)